MIYDGAIRGCIKSSSQIFKIIINIFLLFRLKASYDTITMLERGKDSIAKFQQETTRYFVF